MHHAYRGGRYRTIEFAECKSGRLGRPLSRCLLKWEGRTLHHPALPVDGGKKELVVLIGSLARDRSAITRLAL
jgi:hypothetical protein